LLDTGLTEHAPKAPDLRGITRQARLVAVHAAEELPDHVLAKVDLQAEAFSFTIDEDKQRYLELLDGKLLLVTNTDAPAVEVVRKRPANTC
jgi:hypothetical protein